ncbi:MAG: heme exporter protein CcmD [Pseudomonadota bacterium]|nr:heme exporter protein CcmD [Pseudomonadota bacterium]
MVFDVENAEAGYVIAAYALAAVALLVFLVVTLRQARKRRNEWLALRQRREISG